MGAYSLQMARDPSFSIPSRPRRRYPYSGGVEYEGQTIFRLLPDQSLSDDRLDELLEVTLESGPYQYGDFLNLPLTLYLARDDETSDVFRISIRDGCIRLHVLPETDSAGLRAFYERLTDRTETDWRVDCETSE